MTPTYRLHLTDSEYRLVCKVLHHAAAGATFCMRDIDAMLLLLEKLRKLESDR